MSEQQLHLFPGAKPLLARFGAEFFRAVPPRPGVYIMGGEAERILYIGQSKNLRHRLGSYKNARLDRAPRKVIRLVHAVRSIVWQECESAKAARLKENQLLRIHRPKFNVVNTYPQAYRYVAVHITGDRLLLSLTSEPKTHGNIYGAFKTAPRAYAALLRLLWTARHQPTSPYNIPAPLLASRPPRDYPLDISCDASWVELLKKFLAGESDDLLGALAGKMPAAERISSFQRNFHANDLEVLSAFFKSGPKRNRTLHDLNRMEGPIIPSERLDDFLVDQLDRL